MGENFFFKILKKKFFSQNFDFYSALPAASRGARNIMMVLKMFSCTWGSQKIKFWVKLRCKTWLKWSLKFGENRKFCVFFGISFSRKIFKCRWRLQNAKFDLGTKKNEKTSNLEHFWYPGHLRSSKTKKLGGQNSPNYSCLLSHTVLLVSHMEHLYRLPTPQACWPQWFNSSKSIKCC